MVPCSVLQAIGEAPTVWKLCRAYASASCGGRKTRLVTLDGLSSQCLTCCKTITNLDLRTACHSHEPVLRESCIHRPSSTCQYGIITIRRGALDNQVSTCVPLHHCPLAKDLLPSLRPPSRTGSLAESLSPMPVNVVADARSDAMEKHHALRVNDSHCNVCEHKSHERWWPLNIGKH